MRGIVLGLTVGILVAGCGPEGPQRAASERVVKDAANPGAMWPVMLQHCLRGPGCDPMSDFGQGAGQASGSIGQADYFVESADVVKEGGQDYGGAITISLYAMHGQGGKAGRPLTIDETVSNLRGTNARRSRVSIEYRTPGGGPPEPYSLALMPTQLRLQVPGIEVAKSQEALADATGTFVEAMKWPDGGGGARVEITGKSGIVFSGYSWGIAAADIFDNKEAVKRGFEPWVFYVPQNIRDEPLPQLLAAIEAGETLGLKITAPDGGVMLSDAIYTDGYAEALREATAALADPELAKPISERCQRFAKERQEFWKIADVTAALRVCDPRTPEQRQRDSASSTPSAPVSSAPGQ
jgi:hypothetical protein